MKALKMTLQNNGERGLQFFINSLMKLFDIPIYIYKFDNIKIVLRKETNCQRQF